METIAQTNVQLYNQLQRQQRSAEDLALVRRAYELSRCLYSGYFQADGAPFTAHVTGVASIVASLGLSSELVAAACLHNVYTGADFGDGLGKCVTPRRRKIVAEAVGPEVESYIYRFWTLLRAHPTDLSHLKSQIDTLTPQDRLVLIMDLADTLEKCHELGPLYYGDNERVIGYVEREGPSLIELAERLGQPELAAMLASSIAALLSGSVADSLRAADPRQKYARMQIPNSCVLRPKIVARRKVRRLWQRFRHALRAGSTIGKKLRPGALPG